MKETMKKTILTLFLIGSIHVQAQQSFVATGGDAIGAGGKVSYSIGQPLYIPVNNGTNSISPGVQQPYEISTLGEDHFPDIKLKMMVYPNPAISKVNLYIENQVSNDTYYQLFDTNGRTLLEKKVTETETQIPIEHLPSAIYFLKISEQNKTIKNFKIIKTN